MKFKNVWIVGDTHGEWDHLFSVIKHNDVKDALLLSVGDNGIGFSPKPKQGRQLEFINEFFSKRNITFGAIRGNHDAPSYFVDSFEEKITPYSNIYLLADYTAATINGKSFVFIGGAISIDRIDRKQGVNYWSDEGIGYVSHDLINSLSKQKTGYLITHTGPTWVGPQKDSSTLCHFKLLDVDLDGDLLFERASLNYIGETLKPAEWYLGHYHFSDKKEKHGTACQVLDILELKKLL